MKWYVSIMRQGAEYEGRAGRTEFWNFMLFNTLFLALAPFADILLQELIAKIHWAEPTGIPVVTMVYLFYTFLPGLSVTIRRLHDTGRSGWWVLVNLLIVFGNLLCCYWLITPGEAAANAYGDPVES